MLGCGLAVIVSLAELAVLAVNVSEQVLTNILSSISQYSTNKYHLPQSYAVC